eukprot:938841-Pelagomonas_calceolata.AAC.1
MLLISAFASDDRLVVGQSVSISATCNWLHCASQSHDLCLTRDACIAQNHDVRLTCDGCAAQNHDVCLDREHVRRSLGMPACYYARPLHP